MPLVTHELILVAIGANLPHPTIGPPWRVCEAALVALADHGLTPVRRSGWYESAPVPRSDQPWYVNGVVAVRPTAGSIDAAQILGILHAVERQLGRTRGRVNAARILDLDLLAFGDQVCGWWLTRSGAAPSGAGVPLCLPHPRLHERAFVVLPLREIASDWVHPALGLSISQLANDLPPAQQIRPLRHGA